MGRAIVNRGRSKKVFVNDDDHYENFIGLLPLGIIRHANNKKANEINARVDQINAETNRLRAETDAQAQDVARQLDEAEKKTKEAKDLQDKLKAKLEEAKDNKKQIEKVVSNIQEQTSQTNTKKYLLIGAGVIGLIVIVALVVKK